jgi:hypothetical protein
MQTQFLAFQKVMSVHPIRSYLVINLVAWSSGVNTASIFRDLEAKDQLLMWLLLIVHNLPFLLINMFLVSDWMVYGLINFGFNLLLIVGWEDHKSVWLRSNLLIVSIYTVVFSLNEKVRKEAFIISMTNSKTKKQLMKMFNQNLPTVILSKSGTTQMFNDSFENLLCDSFRIKTVPDNLLKFISPDQAAHSKLFDEIEKLNKQLNQKGSTEFELILNKALISESRENRENREETPSSVLRTE